MTTPVRSEVLAHQQSADRITTDREETKYLLPAEHTDAVISQLTLRLPAHRFSGEGANRLPDPHHFVTTVYFDTPSARHLREARRDSSNNVKLRAKEYYDVHPSLAELATDPSEFMRYTPWLWLELKRRQGARTMKHRFRLLKRDLPRFLVADRDERRELLRHLTDDDPRDAAIEETVEHCTSLEEPLRAACLVNYRRLSWQDASGSLRVTVDVGLAFYAPPDDIWTRTEPLVRGTLGVERGVEPRAVVEVKSVGTRPAWLEDALGRAKAHSSRFSKFVAAAEVVLGER